MERTEGAQPGLSRIERPARRALRRGHRLQRMRLTEAQLKEIWRRQTSRGTPRQAECPTEEQFVRAVTGEMDRQDRAVMASHLVACSDCAEEYRTLRSLRPLAEQVEASLAASAAPAVPEISSKLRAGERTAAEPASPWQRSAALFSPARLAFAFVILILISLALGLWLVLLRQRNDREIAQLNRELAERNRALTSVM